MNETCKVLVVDDEEGFREMLTRLDKIRSDWKNNCLLRSLSERSQRRKFSKSLSGKPLQFCPFWGTLIAFTCTTH